MRLETEENFHTLETLFWLVAWKERGLAGPNLDTDLKSRLYNWTLTIPNTNTHQNFVTFNISF